MKFGDVVKVASTSRQGQRHAVMLAYDENGNSTLVCSCEGYRARSRCRHGRDVALTHVQPNGCPACFDGRLTFVRAHLVNGNDALTCNRCEFCLDFAPETGR